MTRVIGANTFLLLLTTDESSAQTRTLSPRASSAAGGRAAGRGGRTAPWALSLLHGFELRRGGESVRVPFPAQRVLALLALRRVALRRTYVAGVLWLDATEAHAAGSLRSALWKLRRSCGDLVEDVDHRLRLAPSVSVDVRDAEAWAERVSNPAVPIDDADLDAGSWPGELLPDWYEDWVALERERLRQVHAYARETLCSSLVAEGRFAEAIRVGLAAVAREPCRESAHRAVIAAHLGAGNRAEAARQYSLYRSLLADALGLAPSPSLLDLVGDALP